MVPFLHLSPTFFDNTVPILGEKVDDVFCIEKRSMTEKWVVYQKDVVIRDILTDVERKGFDRLRWGVLPKE
jgi:hypothetical protein